ncbi:MAG: hypothetical protein D6830_07110, partial [Ignavibacteria bacterium]
GERVSAKEIEEKILEHPDVSEVAVIGIPDDILGEAPKAYIIPKDGVSLRPRDLDQFLKGRLQSIKIPKYYEFRKELPKNESGKIMKEELKREIKNLS